ncbi:MAG: DUF3426 domain-containing protein [Thaumarchaeota archaeon]|mgnify:FL=1|jgi:hypothetical protein|nr:DUF3426 domain-containing protein [Nitrososphaerota archaeon]MBT5238105.1 DUF3426 domain-containing protein [Nitrososphaerota archaeon]
MKKLIFLIPLLLLIQPAFGEIIVENDQTYIGNDGILHIVGEIKNDTKSPVNKIKIIATLMDGDGEVLDTINGKVLTNIIMPGMKGSFDIITNEKKIDNFFDYDLGFEYKLAAPKNQVIEIISSEMKRDQLNNLIISGTIENNGDITANMINVVATLYDRNGKVLTVSKIQTQPDFLRAGEESHFLVPIYEKNQSLNVADYTIIAESDEYAAVPEFPLGSGALLVISVSSYVIFSRNPERITNALGRCSKILARQ